MRGLSSGRATSVLGAVPPAASWTSLHGRCWHHFPRMQGVRRLLLTTPLPAHTCCSHVLLWSKGAPVPGFSTSTVGHSSVPFLGSPPLTAPEASQEPNGGLRAGFLSWSSCSPAGWPWASWPRFYSLDNGSHIYPYLGAGLGWGGAAWGPLEARPCCPEPLVRAVSGFIHQH